ncbi:haloacid dehalogenase superfamily, subfamily IA, variant 3 with third motif having DD or ED [Geodermatophilus dictyosporus]|uniref:Haloacid dehalogenase superfamily, subfamily IA, variant 3 with third motif having DD or ED n=1 Tax=Geodermatophilus dictyosporus TaxID=1523247 RepID=A0A1I5JU42_9ACTN|nr:HAD family phosphatase [Geodermatophilus dictyosporus]SFO76297.1 haloacid dehalogenase superfamily, subfamily IA, variant 3 with third motif having DD or ED [Geodermatophilus dictyosporus]
MPTTPAAVLFDMDGTLVETEQHWGTALAALARRLGGELSPPAREATVGTSMRSSMRVLHADLGLDREDHWQDDAAWVEDAVAGLLATDVHWRPGARELIAELRAAAVPTALVTTTPRRLADLVLAQVERAFPDVPPFDLTVCGDEVPARKPDPSPYLQAASALGVDPSCCVVVEDSAAGVTAGLAAGAAVLGVPSLQPLTPAPGLVLRDTLTGVGLAELAGVLAAREPAASCP